MATKTLLPIETALQELQSYIAGLHGGIGSRQNLPQIVQRAEQLVLTLNERYQKQLTLLLEDRLEGFMPSETQHLEQLRKEMNVLLNECPCEDAPRNLVWLARQRFAAATPPWMFSSWKPLTKCVFCDNLPRAHSDQCARCFMYECLRSLSAGYGED